MYFPSLVTGPWPSGPRVVRVPVVYMRTPSPETALYPERRRSPEMAGRDRGRGLGDPPTNQQIASGFVSGAEIGASTAISSGSKVAGAIAGGIMAAAPFFGPAAPFVAALGLLVAPIASLFKGCGNTCVQATQYANQSATWFDQILNLYYSQPVRTVAMQQAALANIQQIVQWLQQACSNPALGPAGQRCISERLTRTGTPPGCVTSAGAPMTAGDPGYPAGQPCNVYTFYLNRIAGDTAVVPDPVVPVSASLLSSLGVNPAATVGGISLQNWLLPAALLGAAVLVS